MAGFHASTDQLHQLADQLRSVGVELEDLDPASDVAGQAVVKAARPPRRTGYLANHLSAGPTANGVAFASTARYWTFVHWGAPRRHIKARPFYTEAIQRSRDEVLAAYAQHAQHALEKVT